MPASLVVKVLSERPSGELEDLRSALRAEIERQRVELDQVEEALSLKSRRAPSKSAGKSSSRKVTGSRGPSWPEMITDLLRSQGRPLKPAPMIEAFKNQGREATRGSLHTTLSRMVKRGDLVRLEDGRYSLPQATLANGSEPSPINDFDFARESAPQE